SDRYVARSTVLYFFFFQAEDGIRDFHVTGVQTCALPIYHHLVVGRSAYLRRRRSSPQVMMPATNATPSPIMGAILACAPPSVARSEERRVGKECRCQWAAEQ